MKNELSYLNEEGFTVFTAQYLKNKGTCCKSMCLHCPYGFTIKKCGITFQEVSEGSFEQVEKIMAESKIPAIDWKSYWPEHIRFILLKDKVLGIFLKNNLVIKHLYLLPHYQDQDITKELVEAYFF
ncbi:MAG: DUF5522 domain-containing protein [Bacteriovoracaceae bacterium]